MLCRRLLGLEWREPQQSDIDGLQGVEGAFLMHDTDHGFLIQEEVDDTWTRITSFVTATDGTWETLYSLKMLEPRLYHDQPREEKRA